MLHVVAFLQDSQAVVDGMGTRQTAGLKTNARQQRIGLNDPLYGRGAGVGFQCGFRQQTVIHQRVKAQLCNAQGRNADLAACTGAGTGKAAGSCLKVGGHGIAHAGNRQPDRAVGNDLGVHYDQIGIGGQEQILLEYALIGINDGKCGAGSVSGGDGGADDDRSSHMVGHSLCGVENLAAADTDNHVTLLLFDDVNQSVNLIHRAFAIKIVKNHIGIDTCKAGFDLGTLTGISTLGNNTQGLLAQLGSIGTDVIHLTGTLNIFGGRNKNN